jgi:hypothetical protein
MLHLFDEIYPESDPIQGLFTSVLERLRGGVKKESRVCL